MGIFNKKINIAEGKKYDTTQVSKEGISKEERAELEKKNRKLIDVFKAFDQDEDGNLSSLELAAAMDAFSKMDESQDNKLSKSELEQGAKQLNEFFKDANVNITAKNLKEFIKIITKETKNHTKISTQQVINDFQTEQAKQQTQQTTQQTTQETTQETTNTDPKTPPKELHSYTVQEGESFTGIIKRSLKAQGIENPTAEQIKEAKEKFKENNPGTVKKSHNGVEYLLVGAKVQLEGELEDKNNAAEQQKAWADKYAKPADPQDPPVGQKETPKVITKDDGSSVEFTFDENGNEIKKVIKDANGNVTETIEKNRDADGFITKIVYKDADGNVTEAIEYTYDANGNKTKEVRKDANGKVTGSDEYTNEANGNTVKSVTKDANGNVTETAEYTYDSNGTVIKAVLKDADGNAIETVEYTRDADGNITKTSKIDHKEQRLNQALNDLSPSSNYKLNGVTVNNWGKEKLTKDNQELLDKIAQGDDPAFAAKALLAASKGSGTNDVLFEAVLDAGKDAAYFDAIDKELKKEGTSLYTLAREEFALSGGRTGSKNQIYKEYREAKSKIHSYTEAEKLGYKYTNGYYTDENNNKYKWNYKTLEFDKVE